MTIEELERKAAEKLPLAKNYTGTSIIVKVQSSVSDGPPFSYYFKYEKKMTSEEEQWVWTAWANHFASLR
ncbi:MAG: hypothetical protein INR73_19830 [Williamsia sp.]|nr:hypothetical protein [Williamsia sp.]